jgi:hypothetical protein
MLPPCIIECSENFSILTNGYDAVALKLIQKAKDNYPELRATLLLWRPNTPEDRKR